MRGWRGAMVLAGGAAYFALALSWLGRERLRDSSTFPAASVHNEAEQGCALAYRYLRATRERADDVRILAQPIGWEPLPSNAVVLRLRPLPPEPAPEEGDDSEERSKEPAGKGDASGEKGESVPGKADPARPQPASLLSRDEEAWVRGGGRLVLGLDRTQAGVSVSPLPPGAAVAKVFPVWPGVARLLPPVYRAFDAEPSLEGHALFGSAGRAVVWRRPLGRGEVVFLSTPEVLENRALAQADHLALLSALAGPAGVVYFDERVHGLGRESGLFDLLLRFGLGPALLLALAAFGLLCWRRRTPTGQCEDAPRPRRSEAVDLVDSMALLYGRVLSRSESIERYARSFERAVALRTGLSGRALAASVRSYMGGPPSTAPGGKDLHAGDFSSALARINNAFRRLEDHAHAGRRR